MAKKLFFRISRDILDRFLQSFYHMKALWVQMIDLYLVFWYVKGRCHGNQLILVKCHERRLIPLTFVALSLKNMLQYQCLNVRVNNGDDVDTSCKNLVNFCFVTPRDNGAHLAKIDLHICICHADIQKPHGALESWWAHWQRQWSYYTWYTWWFVSMGTLGFYCTAIE